MGTEPGAPSRMRPSSTSQRLPPITFATSTRVVPSKQRRTLLVDAQQQRQHLGGALRLQRAGGLVGEDQRRAVDDGARDGAALALTERQLRREQGPLGLEPHLLERLEHLRLQLALHVLAADPQRQLDVLVHGAVREQPEVLVDDADRAPEQRAVGARQPAAAERAHRDHAGRGLGLVRDEPQQRGLAGRAVAEDDGTLALLHPPRHVVEREALSVALGHVLE
jgi:hypothetical protein